MARMYGLSMQQFLMQKHGINADEAMDLIVQVHNALLAGGDAEEVFAYVGLDMDFILCFSPV